MDDKISTTAELAEADVLPRKIDVHTDAVSPAGEAAMPDAVSRKPVKKKSPAEWAYQRLVLYIRNFEDQLDSEHEVAVGFAGDEAGVLRIEGMGYFDPDIVTFYGSDPTGARTQLIQHVTQLSVMLRAMPKRVERDAPRRIGFKLVSALEEDV